MESVIGKVDAVSQKFSGGLKIKDTWYNGNEKTEAFVKQVQKGQDVEIQINDKRKIQFLKVLSEGHQPQNAQPTQPVVNKPANSIPMDGEQKKVIVEGLINSYGSVMELCRDETEKLFGTPAVRMADYVGVAKTIAVEKHLECDNNKIIDIAIAMFNADFVSSRGQHCNSLFIALDREVRGRGIIL